MLYDGGSHDTQQYHVADCTRDDRQIHIFPEDLEDYNQSACRKLRNAEGILSERDTAQTVYNKYGHDGWREHFSEVLHRPRKRPAAE